MSACRSPAPSCCNRSTAPRVKTSESPKSCRPSTLTASDVVDRNISPPAPARDSGPPLPAPSRRQTSPRPFLASSQLAPSCTACGGPPTRAAAAPLEFRCGTRGISEATDGVACGNKRAGAGGRGERPDAAAAAAGADCKLLSSRSTLVVRFARKIPHSSESPRHTERQPASRSWAPVCGYAGIHQGFLSNSDVTRSFTCAGPMVSLCTS